MAGHDPVDLEKFIAAIAAVDVSSMSTERLAQLVLDTEMMLNAAQALSASALEERQRRRNGGSTPLRLPDGPPGRRSGPGPTA